MIYQARAILENQQGMTPGHFPPLRKEKLWNKIQDSIEQEERANPSGPDGEDKKVIPMYRKYADVSQKTTFFKKRSPYRAVAVISTVLVALLAAFFFHERTPPVIKTTISMVTKENPRGQKSRVYLP